MSQKAWILVLNQHIQETRSPNGSASSLNVSRSSVSLDDICEYQGVLRKVQIDGPRIANGRPATRYHYHIPYCHNPMLVPGRTPALPVCIPGKVSDDAATPLSVWNGIRRLNALRWDATKPKGISADRVERFPEVDIGRISTIKACISHLKFML